MKYKLPLLTATLVTGLVIGGMTLKKSEATLDTPGVTETVNTHSQVLDDHETRITNVEKDVSDIKQADGPTVKSTQTAEPQPTATAEPTQPKPTETAPEPEPTPTVVSYELIDLGDENYDCEYTYSDETKYRFEHIRTEYNQGTKIKYRSGICDEGAIGTRKST